MRADKTDLGVGLLRLDGFGNLAIVFQRRRAGVDDDVVEIFRDGEAFGHVNVVRRTIKEFGIGRERGGLREPGGIPIAGDFAPRLVTRAGAAVKAVETRGREVKSLAHRKANNRINGSEKTKIKTAMMR